MTLEVCKEDFCPISRTSCPGKCIFSDILESVHTGIIGFDFVREKVVYQNNEAAEIFKSVKPGDYGSLCSLLLPDLEGLLERDSLDIPMTIKYEDRFLDYTVYRVSGEYIWLFIRDITAQKLAEEKLMEHERELQRYTLKLESYAIKLEESEEQFRGIANAATDSIVVLDNEGRITFWNPAAEKMFGYTVDEAVGEDMHLLIAPSEYHDAYRKGFEEFRETGSGPAVGESFEFMALKKDGTRFPIEASTSAIKMKDEWHAVGIIRDITRRNLADKKIKEHEKELERYTTSLEHYAVQLEESREKFSGIANAATDSIVVLDNEGQITFWNPSAEKMFGYRGDEVMGKELHLLIAPQRYHEAYRKGFGSFRKTGKGAFIGRSLEFMARRKDGAEFPIEVSTSAIQLGDEWHAVGIVRDITERKRAEYIAGTVNVINNIGYVFSGIRHEIGNPINSIKTTISVLSHNIEKYSPETAKVYLDRALEELGRVEYLLRSLKSYNMYESADIQNIQLSSFMEKFLSLVENDFSNKGIKITAHFKDGTGWAYADPRALNQVLLNIFTNASDALEDVESPEIAVKVLDGMKTPGPVTIRIRDNGCGMSESQLDNLFRPFYTSKAEGTGLGLVIVKKMLTKMNGTIDIRSRRNFGTSVEISIPGGDAEER
jgi:PAS domain S-box-containing protein